MQHKQQGKEMRNQKGIKIAVRMDVLVKVGSSTAILSQECPNGASVFRGLWTITALAKSASSKLKSLSLSSRKGSDVVRIKGGQLLWERATKS